MTKKRSALILIFTAVVVLGILAVVLLARHHNASQKTGLVITNASVLASIGQKDLAGIQTTLMQKVAATTENHRDYYEATVRSGSFKTTYNLLDGIKTPYYYFVVDIPDAQRTFQVAFSGGDGYPIAILYVLCPKQNQLIYQPFSCQDEGI